MHFNHNNSIELIEYRTYLVAVVGCEAIYWTVVHKMSKTFFVLLSFIKYQTHLVALLGCVAKWWAVVDQMSIFFVFLSFDKIPNSPCRTTWLCCKVVGSGRPDE